ncbi:Mg transporter [Pholiota molesta]|nr:Mg transporter [Pholiota molesta]
MGRSSPSPTDQMSYAIWVQVKGIVVECSSIAMTTVSLLFTGKLLDKVSHWQAMQQVDQLIMIIPSRLDDPKKRQSIIFGSLALSKFRPSRRIVPRNVPAPQATSEVRPLVMVASTTMTAASLSAYPRLLHVHPRRSMPKIQSRPRNIAPAVASCLGDLVTLVLLGVVSRSSFHSYIPLPIHPCCLRRLRLLHLLPVPWKNEHVRPLLTQGIVLDMFVSRYEGFAVLAIVISGLPGAAGSILVSRLSTSLHTAKLALENGLPSFATKNKHPEPSPLLTMATLLAITLPVLSSLLIARLLTNLLWSLNRDPDSYALPIHSALMDLIGQLLLVLCFEIVSHLGIKVRKMI